jgi:hypothetical protein
MTHRPQQCWVKHVHPVGGSQQHNTSAALKPIQLSQQLVKSLITPAAPQHSTAQAAVRNAAGTACWSVGGMRAAHTSRRMHADSATGPGANSFYCATECMLVGSCQAPCRTSGPTSCRPKVHLLIVEASSTLAANSIQLVDEHHAG